MLELMILICWPLQESYVPHGILGCSFDEVHHEAYLRLWLEMVSSCVSNCIMYRPHMALFILNWSFPLVMWDPFWAARQEHTKLIVIYLFLVLFPPAWAQGYGGLFPVSPASVVLWIWSSWSVPLTPWPGHGGASVEVGGIDACF